MLGHLAPILLSSSILGPSWGHLGPSWAHPGAILGPSWAILGPSWGILGHLVAILGPSCGHLGPSWGNLGAILVPSWGLLGSCKPNGSPKLVSQIVPLILLALFLLICKMCVSPRRNAHFGFNTAAKSAGHIDPKGRLGASGAILEPSWSLWGPS